jgi:hypothetical protein
VVIVRKRSRKTRFQEKNAAIKLQPNTVAERTQRTSAIIIFPSSARHSFAIRRLQNLLEYSITRYHSSVSSPYFLQGAADMKTRYLQDASSTLYRGGRFDLSRQDHKHQLSDSFPSMTLKGTLQELPSVRCYHRRTTFRKARRRKHWATTLAGSGSRHE